MLKARICVLWKKHKIKKELYDKLQNVTESLRITSLQIIVCIWRREDELLSKALLWKSKHGKRKKI